MKTTRQSVGGLIAVALFGALMSVGAASASAAEKVTTVTKTTKVATVTKAGWWIRVNPDKTSATEFWIKIGTSKKDSKLWRTWKPGEPVEFDVPADLLNVAKLYLHGQTTPHEKHASLCVFYMAHGVEKVHFAGYVDRSMKQTDDQDDCKP
jgi:hypothetical protein